MPRLRLSAAMLALAALCALPSAASATIVLPSNRCLSADDRVTYGARLTCPFRLWIAADDGTGLRPLGSFATGASVVALSPDAAHLAYASDPYGSGAVELHVRSLRTGEDHLVGSPPGRSDIVSVGSLEWAPDGRSLLASTVRVPDRATSVSSEDLVLIDADGSGTRLVAATARPERSGAFTPDGRTVLFEREGEGLRAVELSSGREAPAEFTEAPTLGDLETAVFSPDGRAVVIGAGGRTYSIGVRGRGLMTYPRWRHVSPGPNAWVGNERFTVPTDGEMTFELQAADAADADAPLRPLLPPPNRDWSGLQFDSAPAWSDSRGPIADHVDPLLELVGGLVRPVSSRARAPRRLAARRGRLGLIAFDASGLRRVQVAITRGAPHGRPVYRTLRTGSDLRKRTRRLRAGRYVFRLRAEDRRGNVRRRAVTVDLRR